MAFHLCTIHAADGTVVCQDVHIQLEVTVGDGADSWYGTVSATHLTALAAGQTYRMVLDDGRGGEFVVRRNTFAGGADRAIAIHGTGALG